MTDFQEAQLVPDATGRREHRLRYHDGRERTVWTVDREVPFPDGKLIVSRTDTAGHITHANPAFIEMSGYTRDELIGQPHSILRHPDMPSSAYRDLWDTVQRGQTWQGHVKNLRKDGAHYWVLATVIPNIRDGVVVGYTSVRRKPSRTQVDACTAQYARMRAEELAT